MKAILIEVAPKTKSLFRAITGITGHFCFLLTGCDDTLMKLFAFVEDE